MQNNLISAAIQGSETAYHELFDQWYPKAYRIGKAICGSRVPAEDAIQEALVRFWRALPRLKEPEKAEGYFMRVVANEARRSLHKRKARPEESFGSTGTDMQDGMGTDIAESEQKVELLKAVELLPEKLRQAVRLHYYGGFTEERTAEILCISLSSVKMRLARGRSKLKTILEHAGYIVEGST